MNKLAIFGSGVKIFNKLLRFILQTCTFFLSREARRRANIIGASWAFYYLDGYIIDIVCFGFGLWLVGNGLMEFKMIFRSEIASLFLYRLTLGVVRESFDLAFTVAFNIS